MRLEDVNCPCCGANATTPWATESGYSLVRCTACLLLYVNPRPSMQDISAANKLGEHRTEAGTVVVRAHRDARLVSGFRRLIAELFPDLSGPVRWLDVGAGYGEMVQAAQSMLPPGSKVQGIEPMTAKTLHAQAAGINVVATPLSEVGEGHDVVSLINVFSHIPDFREFGRELRRVLRPGGTLLLQTGNAADLPSRSAYPGELYLPDHLVFAGEAQMGRILGDLGFRIEQVHRERLDSPAFVVRSAVKHLLRGKLLLQLPGTSPFRLVTYRATRID